MTGWNETALLAEQYTGARLCLANPEITLYLLAGGVGGYESLATVADWTLELADDGKLTIRLVEGGDATAIALRRAIGIGIAETSTGAADVYAIEKEPPFPGAPRAWVLRANPVAIGEYAPLTLAFPYEFSFALA